MNTTPRRVSVMIGALAAAAVVAVGASAAFAQGSTIAGTPVAAAQVSDSGYDASGSGGSGSSGSGNEWGIPSPWGSGGSSGSGLTGPGGTGSTTSTVGSATAAQEIGVVDVTTVLGYSGAEAAGTGMVLTSGGEILTNNHVVEGSTSISVTVVTTGQTYSATVVGTDATDDVAVLQLSGASDLTVANFADTTVAVGDAVTGVGNAQGAGGTPAASPGTVTAVNQTITTQADGSAASETLSGLIETNADIQSGDSGGPLFNAGDQVVGIDTAAEQGGYRTAGYAIPISTALSIAQQIESGTASQNIVIGYPAFLGVQVSTTATAGRYQYSVPSTVGGALISGVVADGPAAAAGLTAGDTITAVDGSAIGSGSALTAALAADSPGQTVTITWVDPSGSTRTAPVTLVNGPAA